MALAAAEQHGLLEAARKIRSLILEGMEALPLVRDMQNRIAVRLRARATALSRSGRGEGLAAVLGKHVGGRQRPL